MFVALKLYSFVAFWVCAWDECSGPLEPADDVPVSYVSGRLDGKGLVPIHSGIDDASRVSVFVVPSTQSEISLFRLNGVSRLDLLVRPATIQSNQTKRNETKPNQTVFYFLSSGRVPRSEMPVALPHPQGDVSRSNGLEQNGAPNKKGNKAKVRSELSEF